jgi:hypothetical protein
MYNLKKDDFDESIEDIMASISKLLDKTGEGYTIDKKEEAEK